MFEFQAAAPVRRAEPNPFTDVVSSIAGKVENGKPVARSFKVSGEHATEKALTKYTKQLQEAGKNLPTPVTVRVSHNVTNDPKTKTSSGTVTFWTVPQIVRKPKTKA